MRYAGMRIALLACSACAVSAVVATMMLPGSRLPTALGFRMSGARPGHQLVSIFGSHVLRRLATRQRRSVFTPANTAVDDILSTELLLCCATLRLVVDVGCLTSTALLLEEPMAVQDAVLPPTSASSILTPCRLAPQSPHAAMQLSQMERHAAALPPRVLRAARSCQVLCTACATATPLDHFMMQLSLHHQCGLQQ